MARPRVFVSSTYYDLKHLRSSLENFVESLGYEPILSEKGEIAYTPDSPLDESCYREVRNADVFVIIIGGRYGSEKSDGKTELPKGFYDRYDSITKQEYKSAVTQNVPVYILIEKSVYADFENYLRNKDNKTFSYAHVDSINIFHLIEEILAQRLNNPFQLFDRYSDIEAWLREQWAGLFRELLSRMTSQQQIASLAAQVGELAQINQTLKRYLEEVVSKVAPAESAKLIEAESERLEETRQLKMIESNGYASYVIESYNVSPKTFRDLLINSESMKDFISKLKNVITDEKSQLEVDDNYRYFEDMIVDDLNVLRKSFGLNKFTPQQKSIRVINVPKKGK
ncbi:MAG: hypothetical protein QOD32_977 [Pyrinomonadaceae bacterium]|jgi:hypothetical protein|nr:hypothetical protein [Pyrinomonadaceae bacterium]